MAATPERSPAFSRPPTTFTDRDDRSIRIERYAGDPAPLVAMYGQFDAESRAQGLPPRREAGIRDWIESLLDDGLNVVAWHDGEAVGHAALMPHDDTAELAIFVRPAYQSAGIGTRLIRALLAHGRANGLDHVWLTVSGGNRVAVSLYRSAGFETRSQHRGECEMERDL